MTESRLDKLKTLLAEEPNSSFLLFAIAREYEGLDQKELALQTYLSLIKKEAAYVGAYYHLAKLYETLADTENALATYQTGILIAQKINDLHALSELKNAKMNLEMDFFNDRG